MRKTVDSSGRAVFGANVRRARTAAGLTIEQVAVALGVTGESVRSWEGGSYPTMDTLHRLARILGTTSSTLLLGVTHI